MAHVTEMLNQFPAAEKGFLESVSPAELIDGFSKLDLSKKKFGLVVMHKFGEVQQTL